MVATSASITMQITSQGKNLCVLPQKTAMWINTSKVAAVNVTDSSIAVTVGRSAAIWLTDAKRNL